MKKQLKIPKFKSESDEQNFWDKNDLADFKESFERISLDLSNLKPSTKPITVRLSKPLLYNLKVMANKRDIPYQSLMKVFLEERVHKELNTKARVA